RAAERADRVGQVATKVVEPHERAAVPVRVLDALEAAEREPGLAAGGGVGQAAAPELVFEQREVRRELAREIRLRAPGPDGIDQAEDEAPEPGGHRGSSVSSLPTKPASRRQRSACFSSARDPALVS